MSTDSGAVQTWSTSCLDLVDQVFSLLDVSSTCALASVHPVTRDLHGRKSIWKRFLRKTRLTHKRLFFYRAKKREAQQSYQREGWKACTLEMEDLYEEVVELHT